MRALPNILTAARLVLTLVVLVCLVAAADAVPFLRMAGPTRGLRACAFVAFVAAAVTDFFDGWLARRLEATSLLGAILDPIADKVLVAAAIVGLVAAGQAGAALPGGLILFREFSVSALRETLAPKGLRLPVTRLAKWKTTVQLIALAVLLFVVAWPAPNPDLRARETAGGLALLWIAALITLWTGAEYALAARRALKAA